MFFSIRKMSLRTRFMLLTAAALSALLVASFVAWRLARATQTFEIRQTESSLQAAASGLVRDVRDHPEGRLTLDQPASPPVPNAPPLPSPRHPPPPPHEVKAFNDYSDPYSRLTAIALHKQKDVFGGFCRADSVLVGYAFPAYAGTGLNTEIPSDYTSAIRELCRQAVEKGDPASRTIRTRDQIVMLVADPVRENEEASDTAQPDTMNGRSPIIAAWAMRRMSPLAGATDVTNFIALVALACAVILVAGLSLMTVRDLRQGVGDIETGLTQLKTNLDHRVVAPRTPELARIVAAINELAASLRANIAKQHDLERDLRKSERLASLGRIVAGVAHEVRNPLASMKLKLQMARRGGYMPDKLEATFRVVLEEIERLDALVRRLLELGRPTTLHRTMLDLNEIARQRAALFTERAERQNVKIIVNTTQQKLSIQGDQDRLAQVLDNLIQNALEAMTEGGTLTVTGARAARSGSEIVASATASARLDVADTGNGVAIEDGEHIFEPFYTGRKTGTGLGLAISREIVEAHGGRIDFENGAEGGAHFFIELPLMVGSEEQEHADDERAKS